MAGEVATVTLPQGQTVRLGRVRPKAMPQALRLSAYYDKMTDSSPPPVRTNWREKAKASLKRMYLNDQFGDCVIAGKYHTVGLWTGNDVDSGGIVLGSDQEVYNSYQSICGPGDNGCVISEVLDVFKAKGLPFSGQLRKIDGYVSVDWTNKTLVQVALQVFGNITLGINLPSAWTQGNDGSKWDVTNSRIVGGHDVPAIDYDEDGVWIATWGGTRLITWAAFLSKRWIEEAYVLLSPDWYGKDNLAPNGINMQVLRDDLAKLSGGIIPDIGPIGTTTSPPLSTTQPALSTTLPPIPPLNGEIMNITLSGKFPTGLFGNLVNVTLTGKGVPEGTATEFSTGSFDNDAPWVLESQPMEAVIPWGQLIKIMMKVTPIVIADLQAGKKFPEILADVLAALGGITGVKTEMSGVTPEQWQRIIQLVMKLIALFGGH